MSYTTFDKNSSQSKIHLVKLEPYLDENSLKNVFNLVYNAKKDYKSEFDLYGVPYDSEFYKMKVLHDSNCLYKLKSKASNPFEAKQLFVTCDYHLTKVRKIERNEYEFLVAITEFYEFILPYLFLSDSVTANPIEMPNFLLASALSIDLSNILDLDSMIGRYLIHDKNINQRHEIISKLKETERFNSIKKKHETLFKQKNDVITKEEISDFIFEVNNLSKDYKQEVKNQLVKNITQKTIFDKDSQISQLKEVNEALLLELEKYKKKEKGTNYYFKMMLPVGFYNMLHGHTAGFPLK